MKCAFDRLESFYIYILVRSDLPVTDQAIQACHAGMEICKRYPNSPPERLVLLRVKNQSELLHWADRLAGLGLDHVCFEEPDHDRSWTALATSPIKGGVKMFRSVPLWVAQTDLACQ